MTDMLHQLVISRLSSPSVLLNLYIIQREILQLVGGTVSQEMGDKIRLLFRLQHSNIAQLYGLYFVSQAAPLPVLVTERLQIPLEN